MRFAYNNTLQSCLHRDTYYCMVYRCSTTLSVPLIQQHSSWFVDIFIETDKSVSDEGTAMIQGSHFSIKLSDHRPKMC